MKLTRIAILALRGFSSDAKARLADALGISLSTLHRYINDNDDNLTKAAALTVIREETGLLDSEILEEMDSAVKVHK